jgi:hypothetical protein
VLVSIGLTLLPLLILAVLVKILPPWPEAEHASIPEAVAAP